MNHVVVRVMWRHQLLNWECWNDRAFRHCHDPRQQGGLYCAPRANSTMNVLSLVPTSPDCSGLTVLYSRRLPECGGAHFDVSPKPMAPCHALATAHSDSGIQQPLSP